MISGSPSRGGGNELRKMKANNRCLIEEVTTVSSCGSVSLGSPGDSVRWVILTKRSESWGSHPRAPISHWLRPAWGWGRSSLPLGRANQTLGVRGSPKAESQVAWLEMVRVHRIWVGPAVSAEYIQWARFWRPVFLKDLNHRLYTWLIKFP